MRKSKPLPKKSLPKPKQTRTHQPALEEQIKRLEGLAAFTNLQAGGLVDSLPFGVEVFSLLTGHPVRTIYNKVHTKAPEFPRPRYVGKHPVWLLSEIKQYIASRPTTPPPRKKKEAK